MKVSFLCGEGTLCFLEGISFKVIRSALGNCIGSLSNYEDKNGYKKLFAAQCLAVATNSFWLIPWNMPKHAYAQIFSLGTRIALKPLVQLGLVLLVLQHNLLAGSTAGFGLDTIYAKLHTYPMDIVRRRMMMRSEEAVKYKNWLDAVSQILKNEGVKSFYKGVGAEMLRMPLLIGVSWLFLTYH
ncbi:hypothetical protein ACOSP7_011997 [Xanthoceras sorbifolium]